MLKTARNLPAVPLHENINDVIELLLDDSAEQTAAHRLQKIAETVFHGNV